MDAALQLSADVRQVSKKFGVAASVSLTRSRRPNTVETVLNTVNTSVTITATDTDIRPASLMTVSRNQAIAPANAGPKISVHVAMVTRSYILTKCGQRGKFFHPVAFSDRLPAGAGCLSAPNFFCYSTPCHALNAPMRQTRNAGRGQCCLFAPVYRNTP